MSDKYLWVDPPAGWAHGFPKLWNGEGDLGEWLREQGYPPHLGADYVRMWSATPAEIDAVQQKLSST